MSEICIREGDQSNPDGTFTVPTVPYTGRCTRAISYPKPKYPFLSYFNNSSDGVDTPLIGPASSKTTAAYTTTVESTPIGNVPCYTVSSGKVALYYSNIPRNAEYSADAFIKIASNTYSSGISLLGYAVKFGSMGGYWAITLNAISISDITYYNGTTFNDSIKFSDTNYEYRYRINNLFVGNAWNHVACNMRNVSGNIWDAVLFVNGHVAMSCRMNTPYGGNGVQIMSYGNTVSLQATQHTVHNGIVFPDIGFTVPSSPYAHNQTIHPKLRRLMYNRKKFWLLSYFNSISGTTDTPLYGDPYTISGVSSSVPMSTITYNGVSYPALYANNERTMGIPIPAFGTYDNLSVDCIVEMNVSGGWASVRITNSLPYMQGNLWSSSRGLGPMIYSSQQSNVTYASPNYPAAYYDSFAHYRRADLNRTAMHVAFVINVVGDTVTYSNYINGELALRMPISASLLSDGKLYLFGTNYSSGVYTKVAQLAVRTIDASVDDTYPVPTEPYHDF